LVAVGVVLLQQCQILKQELMEVLEVGVVQICQLEQVVLELLDKVIMAAMAFMVDHTEAEAEAVLLR
jgi:hypothetical protein